MEKRIKNKYWFWAIVIFGMIGIYLPIVVRLFQKSDNILIHLETVFNLTTYSISILVTSIYTIIIKSSDGSNDFMSKLFDHIGYIVGSLIFVLLINYLVSLEHIFLNYWLPIILSIVGCAVAWKMWFVANEEESFGTGALGN
ncbi:hypothetical protein [Formosa algae]|uniref:hypothetical protein n=1 Tax=Formosa algae TaxID=225843 RepID=UPI000CCEFA10|nr:hypothetical protein [Formosa algae]PNW27811.1 hypothetical protein BKP44_11570 [Formosa algae]